MPNYVAGQERSIEKSGSMYVIGKLAASATQLPINDSNVAFEAASVNAVQAYQGAHIPNANAAAPAPGVTVEIAFPSDPGASEKIEIQESDIAADAGYITPLSATYTITSFAVASDGTFRARADLIPTGGRFLRSKRTKGANAVGCTVKFTKLA